MLHSPKERKSNDIVLFEQKCESIAIALRNSNTPFLKSYRNQSRLADMTLAITSLKIHDKLFEQKYDKLIQN